MTPMCLREKKIHYTRTRVACLHFSQSPNPPKYWAQSPFAIENLKSEPFHMESFELFVQMLKFWLWHHKWFMKNQCECFVHTMRHPCSTKRLHAGLMDIFLHYLNEPIRLLESTTDHYSHFMHWLRTKPERGRLFFENMLSYLWRRW